MPALKRSKSRLGRVNASPSPYHRTKPFGLTDPRRFAVLVWYRKSLMDFNRSRFKSNCTIERINSHDHRLSSFTIIEYETLVKGRKCRTFSIGRGWRCFILVWNYISSLIIFSHDLIWSIFFSVHRLIKAFPIWIVLLKL